MKERLEELQRQYEEKLAHKEELRKKAELTELRLERAAKLVSGLAGERVRWEENVKVGCSPQGSKCSMLSKQKWCSACRECGCKLFTTVCSTAGH